MRFRTVLLTSNLALESNTHATYCRHVLPVPRFGFHNDGVGRIFGWDAVALAEQSGVGEFWITGHHFIGHSQFVECTMDGGFE